jgi:methylmalonyl-CoA mutase (EC 5.4.99.2)
LKITPLKRRRLAEQFEEMRKKIYSLKKTPSIFLATMGPVKQHKARADFARGFFEIAGFNILYNKPFETPEEAAKEALHSGAAAAVICSTDDTYPELVPALAKLLKGKIMLVLAGYPKEQIEAHKASGIDEFIYVGADAYGILNNIVELAMKGGK